jgi:glycosyltransferase involved in cell wall biosynthesis
MSVLNGASTVGAAVRSIQLQTLQDWELIVIDDGSDDDSGSIITDFNDARIRLIREGSRAGLPIRLNQAVALSRGEFIARMDADDVSFPERLERQVARLQQDPELDLLGCGAAVFTNGGALIGKLPLRPTHEEITAQPYRGFPLPHPTWCGRATWFRKNSYDPRSVAAEDQDLLLRTFQTSKFSSLDLVLFGYRQNRLSPRKLLSGRQACVGSLWRFARQSGQFLFPMQGIVSHVLKGTTDLAMIGLGMNRLAQRYRLEPVSASTRRQWEDLQRQLADKASNIGNRN